MKQHGGVGNWVKPAVMGSGVDYKSTSQTFKDFQFDQVDARNEARICTVFDIPPILLGTKVGLQSATYSNYEEARKAWYQHWVSSQWRWLAGQAKLQLLTDYEDIETLSKFDVAFDLSEVKALQEDRTAIFTRATEATKGNVITRDEGREEMGYDPIDNEPVFIGATIRETLTQGTGIIGPEDITGQNTASSAQPVDTAGVNPNTGATNKPSGTPAEQALEKKQFKEFASHRMEEGHSDDIKSFIWRYTPAAKAAQLLREALREQEEADPWTAYGKI